MLIIVRHGIIYGHMIDGGHSPETTDPALYEWCFVPAAPEDLADARLDLHEAGKFRECESVIQSAISELAGNFFKHGNLVPGMLRAIRFENFVRLEVLIPDLSPVEREFQFNFWSAPSFERAYALMTHKHGELELFGEASDEVEGGRGMLITFIEASRRGYEKYVEVEPAEGGDTLHWGSKIVLEYDLPS